LNDRLIFYANALVDTNERDETGHKIVRRAMDDNQAYQAAMQGLSHALLTFWPDVVLMVSAFFTTAGTMQLMRMRNFRIVILCTEAPYQADEQLMRSQLADLVLLNDPTGIERYREITATEYMPHAYRPRVHHVLHPSQLEPGLASDLCFIGTAFKSRIRFFEDMDLDGLDVLIGGNDWGSVSPDSPVAKYVGTPLGEPDCVDNLQTARLYQHAKTGLNFYRRESEDTWDGVAYSCGPREIEMAACGLPFVRDPRPESDELFGKFLPAFDGPGDASEKLRWMLAHDREREKAAAAARIAVQDRTFLHNARRFLTIVDRL